MKTKITRLICFALLSGKGSVWMDHLSFEVVGKDVPTTGESTAKESNSTYVNLDFED